MCSWLFVSCLLGVVGPLASGLPSSPPSPVRHCSSPSGSVDGRILVEEEGGAQQDFTTITWQIGLGETLCYRFKSETGSLSGTVEVTYVSLKSVYSIQDSYQFPLAVSAVSCLCDCPGGASQCSSVTDLCGNKTNCANYYSPSVPATGCFFSFLKLSAAMCCSVQVLPGGEEKYRAVQLGVPSVLAQFRTVYKDHQGQIVDERNYNIDLNSGTTIDWDVSLQVSSPGPTTLVPPGWYVVPETPGQRHSVLAGLDVNPLEGWDPAKVGWVKAGPGRSFVSSGLEHLLSFFSPRVESCSGGKYSGSFSTGQVNKELGGRPLMEVFPFIRDVRVWRRHTELTHRESPLLTLTLQHRTKVGVVVQYSSSHLSDFTGLLYQDSLSHLHLNLSLFGAAGTITGVVSGSSSSQSILIRLPLHPDNSTHQIALSSLTQCQAGQVTVSLRPLSLANVTIRKSLPCVRENLRTFRSIDPREDRGRTEVLAEQLKDCLSCSASWLHWLDPAHWMEASWGHTRVVISVCASVGALLLLLLLYKCLASLCCCCD